jgi:hypothetical protein
MGCLAEAKRVVTPPLLIAFLLAGVLALCADPVELVFFVQPCPKSHRLLPRKGLYAQDRLRRGTELCAHFSR